MKPFVVVMEKIHPDGLAVLDGRAEVVVLDGPSDPLLPQVLARAAAVIVRSTPFRADLIDSAPALRVIGRHGAGLDNIDVKHAYERGITVANTPRSNTVSVAEYVITVILLLAKRIDEISGALVSGQMPPGLGSLPAQVTGAGLIGQEVAAARLGVIGLGAIGREVTRCAQALGMEVTAFDPFLDAEAFDALEVRRAATLVDLLPRSDYLTVHVPGGDYALIGADELALLPRGAFVINTARGGVVDADALVEAVRSGHLAGAAVDVFEPEPPDPSSPLLHTPRIICTPHMAAMTAQALRRMAIDVATSVLERLEAAPDTSSPRPASL